MAKAKLSQLINNLTLILKNRLFIFLVSSIIYLELAYCLFVYKQVSLHFVFPILFSFTAGAFFYLLMNSFQTSINKYLMLAFTAFLSLVYSFYLLYFRVFKATFSIYSFVGAKDALQFSSIIKTAVADNLLAIVILTAPVLFLITNIKLFSFDRMARKLRLSLAVLVVFSFMGSVLLLQTTDQRTNSQYMLYHRISAPHLMVKKLGLLTTIRLDIKRLLFGHKLHNIEISYRDEQFLETLFPQKAVRKLPKIETIKNYNMIEIPYIDLIANEKNPDLLDMHRYFSGVKPTAQNQYTGIFRGHNLILLTAEAFYPYAISPELTPTLYKMATEGFIFNNFYNPLFSVSTSDGEYVICTGLLPKAGVWSMSQSGKNNMSFSLGNQFKKLGYSTKAYHNHSYNYYNRHISHPNLGYDYQGIGNGLELTPAWPSSDLEMIEATTDEYIHNSPFHSYYMTVSGHFEYNFIGNHMAIKNQKHVQDLPYSEQSKAYLACNLELEFAVAELVKRLEAAGIAEKTVIAISPDHYPYGLSKKSIDELAGHPVEGNFEIHKSKFILWKKGMTPITVDKLCASIDILPTLSNLFALKYDSRLMIGQDILSTAKPLVIFANRSWITEKGRYNALTDSFDGELKNASAYVAAVSKEVESKFFYSAKILEKDYYQWVMP